MQVDLAETKKIVAVIMSAYPAFRPPDIELTVATWAAMLDSYPYDRVAAALKEYVLTDSSGFAPSIGQVAAIARRGAAQDAPGEQEAWEMVQKALGNSGYHAEEEFARLPGPVRAAVGSPRQLRAWATDCGYSEGVARANFRRMYRDALDREECARIAEFPSGRIPERGEAANG